MGYIFDALKRGGTGKAIVPSQPDATTVPRTEPAAPLSVPVEAPVVVPTTTAEDSIPPQLALAGTTETKPYNKNVDDRLVALTAPASLMAEEYRSIRTSLLARWQHRHNLLHTITSATPQEGKTITSLNLGLSFAELRNRKTIVVEADLRLPQFQTLLALPESKGVVGVVEEGLDARAMIQEVEGTSLHVLQAGGYVENRAVQLLSSNAMSNLLLRLREKYDHVIIDTPPVVELADAGILGAQSDDVLLVARLQRTPRELIEQAIRNLASFNAPVAGVIATDQKRAGNQHYLRYGRYGYGYGYGSGQRTRKSYLKKSA